MQRHFGSGMLCLVPFPHDKEALFAAIGAIIAVSCDPGRWIVGRVPAVDTRQNAASGVLVRMFLPICQFEILDPVVSLVAVLVMNKLVGFQRAA